MNDPKPNGMPGKTAMKWAAVALVLVALLLLTHFFGPRFLDAFRAMHGM